MKTLPNNATPLLRPRPPAQPVKLPSIASELTRCRSDYALSQVRLSQLLEMKLHRLSDLEKARSFPQPREEQRLRRRLRELRHQLREEAARVEAALRALDRAAAAC